MDIIVKLKAVHVLARQNHSVQPWRLAEFVVCNQLLKDVGLGQMGLPHAVELDQQDVIEEVLELLHEQVLRLEFFLLMGQVCHAVCK